MGAVYLARDTKLNRNVALKVLPEAMACDANRLARFRREAQAVAALNHPHIVTIHSVEEVGEIRFLTMELVEGQNLDRSIPAGGMSLARVFDIGSALADALAAAHEKGIIHRDLKPANIMVTRVGRVKVLDFGLAKLSPETPEGDMTAGRLSVSETPTQVVPRDRSLTETGLVVGTVPYMSPEQLAGEAVDARTDIFSLGVVLYELTTGRRPFLGGSRAETISAILRDAPRPATEARPDAPRHLGRIIDHCLQKDPEARFQNAKDVRNELMALRKELESVTGPTGEPGTSSHPSSAVPTRRAAALRKGLWVGLGIVAAVAVIGIFLLRGRDQVALRPSDAPASTIPTSIDAPDSHSIAVLPFVNMSEDPANEYFSDGVSEQLLNLLAKVPQLKVAASTSSFSFKGKEVEISEIARQLHVAHLLEGSVRKSGNQVRVTAQLIHSADGFQLWSQTYDRELEDIFKIQDEIAAEVVEELKVTLLGAPPKARTTDPQAYALYLQAVQVGRQRTAEMLAKSDALYHQVLELDPRYVPAWVGLASNTIDEAASLGLMSPAEGSARAREMAEKALSSDPDHASALAELGHIAMLFHNDLAGAAKYLERALALDPADLVVLRNAASLLRYLGRVNETLAVAEAIVRRDPVNVRALGELGAAQRDSGRFDEAIATFRTVLSLNPGAGGAHYAMGEALLLTGDAAGALAVMEQEPIEGWREIGLAMAYDAVGRKAESDMVLAALIAKAEEGYAYNIADIYAFRGEADKAFEWLDKAVEYGDTALTSEIVTDRLFDTIRSDPRWPPFLSRLGKAPDQLSRIEFKVTLPG